MCRRLAALVCSLGLVVALVVAAFHQHDLRGTQSGAESAACMYCSGGIAPTSTPAILPAAERVWTEPERVPTAAPELKRRLALDHSGNAPPV